MRRLVTFDEMIRKLSDECGQDGAAWRSMKTAIDYLEGLDPNLCRASCVGVLHAQEVHRFFELLRDDYRREATERGEPVDECFAGSLTGLLAVEALFYEAANSGFPDDELEQMERCEVGKEWN